MMKIGFAARHSMIMLILFGMSRNLPRPGRPETEIATPGGPLLIEQMDANTLGSDFRITLAGHTVLRSRESDDHGPFSEFPRPEVIQYFAKRIGSFDAVAVFQQFSWGNACNGGPVWLLGIFRDGTYERSKPIDACGGPSPKVALDRSTIHITLGPAEEWAYNGRQLRRIR